MAAADVWTIRVVSDAVNTERIAPRKKFVGAAENRASASDVDQNPMDATEHAPVLVALMLGIDWLLVRIG